MAQVEEPESGEVGEGRVRDAHDVVPREGEFPQSPGPLEDRRVDDLNLQKFIKSRISVKYHKLLDDC